MVGCQDTGEGYGNMPCRIRVLDVTGEEGMSGNVIVIHGRGDHGLGKHGEGRVGRDLSRERAHGRGERQDVSLVRPRELQCLLAP